MKKLACLLALLAPLALATVPSVPTSFILAWSYPTNVQVDAFYIYSSPSPIVPPPWTPFTNTAGTNLSVVVTMLPGQQYFYCTASNFWGESGPSNVTNTPVALTNNPTGLNLHR